MKKGILVLSIVFLSMLCAACSHEGQIKREQPLSTDLTAVNVNGILLNIPSESLDLTQYTAVPKEQTAGKKNT